MKRKNDKYIGQKINDWTIVGYEIGKKGVMWLCECKCGRRKLQKVWNVKSGKSKMCKACNGKLRRREGNGYKDNKQ